MIEKIINELKKGSLGNKDAIYFTLDSIYEFTKEQVFHDYAFLLEKRQAIRVDLNNKSSSIRNEFLQLQEHYQNSLEAVQDLETCIINNLGLHKSLIQFISKVKKYYDSNKFKEGHRKQKNDLKDIFIYIQNPTLDKGILDVYNSKFISNVESNWLTISQSYAKTRLYYAAIKIKL